MERMERMGAVALVLGVLARWGTDDRAGHTARQGSLGEVGPMLATAAGGPVVATLARRATIRPPPPKKGRP